MVRHLCNHDQVRGVIENPSVLECPVLARDSLVLKRFGKDGTHPFTWLYRSDPSYRVGPVRVSEECTREDSGARTNSEGTSILTEVYLEKDGSTRRCRENQKQRSLDGCT
jgi:hypothetical protein